MAAPGGDRRQSSTSFDDVDRSVSPVSFAPSIVDTFSDEFAVSEYAPSIRPPSEVFEDPFRDPASSHDNLPENPFDPPEHSHSTLSLAPRNSIRKSSTARQTLLDTATTPFLYPDTQTNARRSVSSTSYAGPLSPASSEYGPSHPYGMYPQVGVSRTGSLAAPEPVHQRAPLRSTNEIRQGPAHPYSLYPQDVSSVSAVAPLNPPIPVGFPGHVQAFHRSLGAEGEEQDIVGLDGHMEQLPPYSRWPEEASSKTLLGPMPIMSEVPSSTSAAPAPEERTTPVVAARATANASPSPVLAPAVEDEAPIPEVNTQPVPIISEKPSSEKSWSEKNVKEKGKTKVCGFVRLWILCLIFTVVAIVVIICGTFISIYVRKQSMTVSQDVTRQESHSAPTTITYIDAAPTATPTDLAPLPTGTFLVPLGPPDTNYNQCLGSDQVEAWTCSLPGEQSLCVSISQSADNRAFLNTCNNQTQSEYGTQPPFIIQQTLKLVTDLDNVTLGPAWHFQTFYDKLVILPEHFLPSNAPVKRSTPGSGTGPSFEAPSFSKRKRESPGKISVGDQAWFCHWDDTFIEGFIYASISNPGPSPPTGYTLEYYGTPQTSDGAFNFAAQVAAKTPSPRFYRHRNYAGFPFIGRRQEESTAATTTETPQSAATIVPDASSLTRTTASDASESSTSATPSPTCIPKLVKLEERRLEGLHDTAICNLMRKMDDLSFVNVHDANEVAISLVLVEDDGPAMSSNKLKSKLKRAPMVGGGAALARRGSGYVAAAIDETCYCEWTSEKFS